MLLHDISQITIPYGLMYDSVLPPRFNIANGGIKWLAAVQRSKTLRDVAHLIMEASWAMQPLRLSTWDMWSLSAHPWSYDNCGIYYGFGSSRIVVGYQWWFITKNRCCIMLLSVMNQTININSDTTTSHASRLSLKSTHALGVIPSIHGDALVFVAPVSIATRRTTQSCVAAALFSSAALKAWLPWRAAVFCG